LGKDATTTTRWQRLEQAATRTVLDVETWAPLAGALVLVATDADASVATWCSETAPFFGSAPAAARRSDELLDATAAVYWISVLASSGGDEPASWLFSTFKRSAVGLAAVTGTHELTAVLKRSARRPRPDDSDRLSFPSGHASRASAFGTLARRNAAHIHMGRGARAATQIGMTALGVATAWARLEAGKHYPTDVLVGWSLGHAVSGFMNDALLGTSPEDDIVLDVSIGRRGFAVGVRISS
jgi:membrane-associated phospholipid phosphatase